MCHPCGYTPRTHVYLFSWLFFFGVVRSDSPPPIHFPTPAFSQLCALCPRVDVFNISHPGMGNGKAVGGAQANCAQASAMRSIYENGGLIVFFCHVPFAMMPCARCALQLLMLCCCCWLSHMVVVAVFFGIARRPPAPPLFPLNGCIFICRMCALVSFSHRPASTFETSAHGDLVLM